MFLLDMTLFAIPLFLLSYSKTRANPQLLFVAAVSMLLAGMLYRFNAFLVGYIPPDGYTYFPSVTEILVSMGMVSMEIMAFLIFVKKLPILARVERA
jgi:Ni/Fe-hydrogenase subunit HybB-like protein